MIFLLVPDTATEKLLSNAFMEWVPVQVQLFH